MSLISRVFSSEELGRGCIDNAKPIYERLPQFDQLLQSGFPFSSGTTEVVHFILIADLTEQQQTVPGTIVHGNEAEMVMLVNALKFEGKNGSKGYALKIPTYDSIWRSQARQPFMHVIIQLECPVGASTGQSGG